MDKFITPPTSSQPLTLARLTEILDDVWQSGYNTNTIIMSKPTRKALTQWYKPFNGVKLKGSNKIIRFRNNRWQVVPRRK